MATLSSTRRPRVKQLFERLQDFFACYDCFWHTILSHLNTPPGVIYNVLKHILNNKLQNFNSNHQFYIFRWLSGRVRGCWGSYVGTSDKTMKSPWSHTKKIVRLRWWGRNKRLNPLLPKNWLKYGFNFTNKYKKFCSVNYFLKILLLMIYVLVLKLPESAEFMCFVYNV